MSLERVAPGFDLSALDPASTPGFPGGKKDAEHALAANGAELSSLQERLYAESRSGGTRSILLVLQAMDTAGKGGIIRHVISETDPQGIQLHAFKAPTDEEKAHDFLWRVRKELPRPGLIGVFDRSHYEDVLIHRVHGWATPDVIEQRYEQILAFEREVVASGTAIVKVMLHISSDEQKARLEARLGDPEKYWKYNPGDVDERMLWPAYQEAYQLAMTRTSTSDAPWYVVPANRKWYARWAVQNLLVETLRAMDPQWPAADFDVAAEQKRLAAS